MTQLSASFLKQCARVVGKENILIDDLSRTLYSYDCSLSHTRPNGVVLIKNAAWIAPVVALLAKEKIPFLPRASATNHAGGCAPLNGGIILNLTHLNKILEINPKDGYAIVEPGVITAQLQKQLFPLGFFYAPDPASAAACTIGGNLAQNASGARCMKYGGTLDHVLEASVVLPNGKELLLSRKSGGPDLIGLLAGSEGTLGIITRLKVKILPLPAHIHTFLVSFPSLQSSIQSVTDLVARGILPRCVEAFDQTTANAIEDFAHAGYPTDAPAVLLFELDGTTEQIEQDTRVLEEICNKNGALQFITARSQQERARLWEGRRSAYAAMARLAPSVMVGDGTVPRSELPRALAQIQAILQGHQLKASLLFHAGDGNFHPQIIFNGQYKPDVLRVKQALKQILQVCVDCGGTVSGEHGIGVEKRALMAYQYDKPTLDLLARIKQATDPKNLSNPLKIVPIHYEEEAAPARELRPEYQELCSVLAKGKVQVVGNNSRLKTKKKNLLSTRNLNKILDIDTANYTVTAQAGVVVNDLLRALAEKQLFCALPPSGGTLGGLVAAGGAPEIYAHLLGVEALLADGSYVRYGGKFMKNAAGYPLTRLFAGSQGQWGIITQLTLRVFATPVSLATEKSFRPFTPNEWTVALKKTLDPTGVFL